MVKFTYLEKRKLQMLDFQTLAILVVPRAGIDIPLCFSRLSVSVYGFVYNLQPFFLEQQFVYIRGALDI